MAAVRQETPGATLSSDLGIDREWIADYGHAAGDLNPVHLDTETARSAGFEDVIAHGMSLVALAVEEAAERYADGDVDRVRAIGARFARPVLPGEGTSLDLTPAADGGHRRVHRTVTGAPSPSRAAGSGWPPATGAGR